MAEYRPSGTYRSNYLWAPYSNTNSVNMKSNRMTATKSGARGCDPRNFRLSLTYQNEQMKTFSYFIAAIILAIVFYTIMLPVFIYGNYTVDRNRLRLAWNCFMHSIKCHSTIWFTVHETRHFFQSCRRFA